MKKILSLVLVLGLMACAKAPQSGQTTSDSAVAGIIGGDAVSTDDPIAHTTVQVYAFIEDTDPKTGQKQYGLASCTGSVVSEDVILTAGHCSQADPSMLFVYFSKDIPANLEDFVKNRKTNPLFRQVIGGVSNPAWAKLTEKKMKNWGDLSLLKFDGKLPDGYKAADLIQETAKLTNGSPITLAGFGLTAPMLDENNPSQATELRKVTVDIKNAKYSKTEILLATGDGKGSCHGDSGGPGFVTVDGKQVVAGITSRADISTDPQGQCTGLTIYTAVAPYVSWIASTVQYLDSANFKPAPIDEPGVEEAR